MRGSGAGSFLKVVAINFDVLAGPVVSLLYPLYASIRAIESNSPVDDQQWLTYWILYSMITLFELTFAKIIEWIPIWSYAKLILTCWLVIPYFNGAAYVYEHFVRPTFVTRQPVNIWYIPRKKDLFGKPDDINTAAEEYMQEHGTDMQEHGTEEFEKMIHREKASFSTPLSPNTGGRKIKVSRCFSYGSYLCEGKSNHDMEDYLVSETKQVNNNALGLFAIFDGHMGHNVAKYLQSHLFDNILKKHDFWTNTENAIKRAYHTTDKDILKQSLNLGRGGSTAVTAILINSEKLVVANVGDSRAVMNKKGVAVQLSVDHEPSKEKEKIESKGGFVSNHPGDVPRVDGKLAVARAFGDKGLKRHISSEPDIVVKMIDNDVELIILASDGLWKVMSNQEAVDAVKNMKDTKSAAKLLTKEAVSRKSRDDISCIVVRFR